jgi:hypothetical protein
MIRRDRELHPAATLMELSGQVEFKRRKRAESQFVMVDAFQVMIRDQAPLHAGNIDLTPGYQFESFLESLNRKVFFWPGTASGPISYGLRHFGRYRAEGPVILRVRSADLIAANPDAVPLYCKYNSGSPRCSYGRKSPRGPDTFVGSDRFDALPGAVVEVTFEASVQLPGRTEHGPAPTGPWRRLA